MRGALAVLLAAALAVLLAACGPAAVTAPPPSAGSTASGAPAATTPPPSASTPAAAQVELTVYAAASLQRALEALVEAYTDVAPEVTITVSAGSSSALRTQIEQGAPADVYLSADTTNPAALVAAGLTAGEAKLIAGNGLAVIVPAGNPAGITTPADLARTGVRIVAAGDAVPITGYADALVTKLAGLAGYPEGFADAYDANVVSREDDVSAVLAKIELGEGDAAIVYRTDAQGSDAVATVPIPPEADVVASYAGAVIGRSEHLLEARAFLDWLSGPDAQGILATFGFSPPGS